MRIAMGIEYDGSCYHGWQRQNSFVSVQQNLEEALQKIALEPISVTCAGRTDAGVHATYQVVHFDTDVQRPIRAWTRGVNTHLAKNIGVKWAKVTSDEFHARFSARSRRYRYIIYNHALRPAILNAGITHIYYPLDVDRMHRAAQCLVGEHDFTSFRAVSCQSHSPVRTLSEISVTRKGDYVVLEVAANAFLHHMVRNLVGSLVKVGTGECSVEWMQETLEARDRKVAGATAQPNGLYLVDVSYPEEFAIPKSPFGPIFL
ncbi:tRNA pseudouridine(38-40) synthase TruA [Glaciecola sp. MH2013]|uniref:tRNA pseudouridine(38-40) synthase TruA n=1 Tax=Glaciecola sp. MH2013 TaxID=2785524 RepID=UPI00189F25C1|nr:tRNA pseudouridine(38-40) synthase TruA [Glaciecola sp. MH2013]MBF7073124.1 tRNA pseudouridine(38-40) synthase TruA [Glaciecola sp. MH2013]